MMDRLKRCVVKFSRWLEHQFTRLFLSRLVKPTRF
jgi:hypothetical protein